MRRRQKILIYIPSLGGGGAEKVVYDYCDYSDDEKFELMLYAHDYSGIYGSLVNARCLEIPAKKQLLIWKLIKLTGRAVSKATRRQFDICLYLKSLTRRRIIKQILSRCFEIHDPNVKRRCYEFVCSQNVENLVELVRREKPDLIWCHMLYANAVTYISREIVGHGKFPKVVAVEHIARYGHTERFFLNRVDREFWHGLAIAAYRSFEHVACVSLGVLNELAAKYNVPSSHLRTIYNGVNLASFAAAPAMRAKERPFLINIGRLVPQKQQDQLIRAYGESGISETHDLLILGEGEKLEELQSLVREINLEDRVHFEGFKENVSDYLQTADCFVLSSAYEGFGIVLVEAMAAGCPVISYDCEFGPSEIFSHGIHGFLVAQNDVEALAAAMRTIVSDPEMRTRMSIESKNRASSFSLEKMVASYEQLFCDVLGPAKQKI